VAVLGRRNTGTALTLAPAVVIAAFVVTVDAVVCFTADTGGGGGNAVLDLLIYIDFNINNSNL